jgi:hypothetical protein
VVAVRVRGLVRVGEVDAATATAVGNLVAAQGDDVARGLLAWAQAAAVDASERADLRGEPEAAANATAVPESDPDAEDANAVVVEYVPQGGGPAIRVGLGALEALQMLVIRQLGGAAYRPEDQLPQAYRAAADPASVLGGRDAGGEHPSPGETATRRILLAGLQHYARRLDLEHTGNATQRLQAFVEYALTELEFDAHGYEVNAGGVVCEDLRRAAVRRLDWYPIGAIGTLIRALDTALAAEGDAQNVGQDYGNGGGGGDEDDEEEGLEEDVDDDCPVCMEAIRREGVVPTGAFAEENGVHVRVCIHVLCSACSEGWWSQNTTCPTCRREVAFWGHIEE